MEIALSTPALLFPALSLLMLSYSNRFLAVANLIRNLYSSYKHDHDPAKLEQIDNLRRRINIIRNMQSAGAASIFCCVLCMFLIYIGQIAFAHVVFVFSLISMLISLALSISEIYLSTNALNTQLADLENLSKTPMEEATGWIDNLLHRKKHSK